MLRLVLVGLMLTGLTGCQWMVNMFKPEVVVRTKFVGYDIPDVLLSDCELSKPTSVEKYMGMDGVEREKDLSRYIIVLYGDVKKCNVRSERLREYVEEKEREVEELNRGK